MTSSLNGDRPIRQSVVRIARSQILRAIQEIENQAMDRHEVVHQVRRRCKALRALLRLVQPALGKTYRRENGCFRGAAKSLSYLRDAQTLVDCLDDLAARFDGELDLVLVRELREQLIGRRDRAARDRTRLEESLQAFLVTLRDANDRLPEWTMSRHGFSAVAGGLHKTYQRGRKAMRAAYSRPSAETPSAEQFHQWRKCAKYHAYHLRMLRPLWKPVLRAQERQAETLAELLGNDHDLDVLRQTLLADPASFGDERRLAPLLHLMNQRHQELRNQARILGGRVFAERPDALVARFAGYWDAWPRKRALERAGRVPMAPAAAAVHSRARLHRAG